MNSISRNMKVSAFRIFRNGYLINIRRWRLEHITDVMAREHLKFCGNVVYVSCSTKALCSGVSIRISIRRTDTLESIARSRSSSKNNENRNLRDVENHVLVVSLVHTDLILDITQQIRYICDVYVCQEVISRSH